MKVLKKLCSILLINSSLCLKISKGATAKKYFVFYFCTTGYKLNTDGLKIIWNFLYLVWEFTERRKEKYLF